MRPDKPTDAVGVDAAVIAGVCQRESAACRVFIRRFQGPVGALLRRLLGPAGLDHLTDDLAQETMLRAVRGLERFDPEGSASLSTWVLTIATRLGINELQRRRLAVDSGVGATEVLVAPQRSDDQLRRRRVASAIADAVGQLQPKHRAAFLLREYHGLDYDEIARALDLSIGTVKSRLSRARAQLRERLAELHEEHKAQR